MNASAPHQITDLETLQQRVGGDPHPIARHKVFDQLDERAQAFVAQSPFVLLATSDKAGRLDVSPKGDGPGFVWVENGNTLWIPDRPGNKLIMGHKNLLENPRAGLLFMIPGTEETLRANGRATIHDDPAVLERLAARGKSAVVAIRLEVEECFFHCAKAFKRSKLWQPDQWPAERFRISFGEILAPAVGGGAAEAKEIDELVEQDYREAL